MERQAQSKYPTFLMKTDESDFKNVDTVSIF